MSVLIILLFADVSKIDKSVVRSYAVDVINYEVFIYVVDDKCFEDESMCILVSSMIAWTNLDFDVSIWRWTVLFEFSIFVNVSLIVYFNALN